MIQGIAPVAQEVIFRAVDEAQPGSKLRALYARRSEAYMAWFLREGDASRPSLQEGVRALEAHMPELVPVHAAISAVVADNEPTAMRMFTFLRPPASSISCSQAVWREADEDPLLVRNYDYPAELIDGVVLRSRFLDRTVVGTADGIWGLCDGMNDRGLVASLTFGGRAALGDGFGMPLVVRYLLETCDTVREARPVLERLPYAQVHNLTLADASGDVVTAYLSPDRPVSFRRLPVATNHQWVVEARDPAFVASTLEREWWLLRLLDDPDVDAKRFSEWFLTAPLYSYGYADGTGTVYTAAYGPAEGSIVHRWPGQDWFQSLDDFTEGERAVSFAPNAAVG
jgi:predicted choloylglycine hydrolase